MFDDNNDGGIQFSQQYQHEEQQMANIKDMVESKYLKQGDVPDDIVVTIVKVGKGNIAKEGDEPEYKWMIRFEEFKKAMIINQTNIKRLARACKSEETNDWVGKKVTLYTDPDVEFAGNVVGGLRIKEFKAPQTTHKGGDGGKGTGPEDMESDIPW
jgi:hypothetical protein